MASSTREVAGTLTRQLVLQRPSESTGDPVVTYLPVATVWAQKLGLSGRESTALQAEADYRLRIRHRTDIKSTDRFLDGPKVLEILSILDLTGEQRELQVLVREKVA